MKTAILFFLICFSHSAIAEMYRCVQSGRTTYSSSPCGDNAKVVQDHFSVTAAPPRIVNTEPNLVKSAPPQSVVAPAQIAAPVQMTAPVVSCDYAEAALESVKKTLRAGYPASESDYWLERYKKARDAYDVCWEQRQQSLSRK